MKRFLVFIVFVQVYIWGVAQQALWGEAPIVSPEIHDDNTVTFRIKVPKAVQVKIVGDFLPPQKIKTDFGEFEGTGSADLVENKDGIWEFTTPKPLPSELYSYSFVVDGVKMSDPNNVCLFRDVNSFTNYFVIGGGCGDLYKVNDVPHGCVSRVWYDSPTLGMRRCMTIYTPADYFIGKKAYPVLYLMHGAGGDENSWTDLGRAAQILDNLIAQQKVVPMIVVMPNGNSNQDAAPGEGVKGIVTPMMDVENMANGKIEKSFHDIMAFVEKNYRTIQNKNSRAIAGLSMGGFHSIHISAYYPDKFAYVGPFSPGIVSDSKAPDAIIYEDFEEQLARQFEHAPKVYAMYIGKKDFLYEINKEYCKMLDQKGYKYTYVESEDGHIWKNWRIYLTDFLPQLFHK